MSEENKNEFKFHRVEYKRKTLNRKDVLDSVASGDIKPDEAEKMLRTRQPPRFVVTRTGAIALYNLQRNPIVLYADQWDKLSNLIKRGILDNYVSKNSNIIKRKYNPLQDRSENRNEDRFEDRFGDRFGDKNEDRNEDRNEDDNE